jgi:hypothetical protein
MVGNPYQMTRSDAGNKKGFYILDFEKAEETFYENEYSPKFVRVYLNKFLDKTTKELEDICRNNRVDLYVPSSFLLKYQINPIIDILSLITKKLEVIPFEDDLTSDLDLSDEVEQSYNIYGLCERYIKNISTLDDTTKERVLAKINSLYINVIKETRD